MFVGRVPRPQRRTPTTAVSAMISIGCVGIQMFLASGHGR
jgi:hypothetical protein